MHSESESSPSAFDGAGAPAAASVPRGSLAGVGFFAPLDPRSRAAVEQLCVWRGWRKGQHILDRDGRSDDLYLVIAGRVRIVDFYDSRDRFVIFDEITAGGCFGELAAIDRMPRSAYVVAAAETVTAALAADAFIDVLFRHKEAGMEFLRRLTEMVRQSDSRIMDISTLTAQERVHLELLRRAKVGGGRPVNTAIIRPSPNHGEMASRLSTTRETVSRVLGELTRQGLLQREEDALVVRDLGQLVTLTHKHRE
jgi:CRP/FNR family transcriptional regulator, cyclic AMP receptor protein